MESRKRLTLNKETIRELQDSELALAVGGTDWLTVQPGGGTDTSTCIGSGIPDVCSPNWVSTSPPTHLC